MKTAEHEQRQITQQISDRAANGRPCLAVLNDMLDAIEDRRADLEGRLNQAPAEEDFGEKIRKAEGGSQSGSRGVDHQLRFLLHARARRYGNEAALHHLIQKVVISKTPGHQPASPEVHGPIASILAAMEAATILEKQFEALKRHDYLEKMRAGELDAKAKRQNLPGVC